MQWLVTGAAGMLGSAIVEALDGERVTAAARWQLDITDDDAVADLVACHDIVINAAAWTDVDGAETDQAKAELANVIGPAVLAAACAKYDKLLIHVSSDYVFKGDSPTYAEDSPTDPINVYGRTKASGERAVRAMAPDQGYVVRTAWLYDTGGVSFLTNILRALEHNSTVDVVRDQFGQPTWVLALALQLRELGMEAQRGDVAPGIYHGSSLGCASRYRFAQAICEEAGIDPARVRPVTTQEFTADTDRVLAPRPQCTALSHHGTPVPRLGHWRKMLGVAFQTLHNKG